MSVCYKLSPERETPGENGLYPVTINHKEETFIIDEVLHKLWYISKEEQFTTVNFASAEVSVKIV